MDRRIRCEPLFAAKLLLACVSSGATLVTCLWVVSAEYAERAVGMAGYWWELILVITIVAVVVHSMRWSWRRVRCFFKKHSVGLVVALGIGACWHVGQPHQFKVLYDEHVFAGISRTMHRERVATYPIRAHILDGRIVTLNDDVDKRPLLFPFLVSVIHDATGYRVQNSLVLNALLGIAFLVLVYGVAVQGGGGVRAGIVGMLLLGGLPLLPESVTGGGYDVLNLCVLVLAMLAARGFLRRAGAGNMNLVACACLLLAQVRYESILFMILLPVFFLMKWRRRRVVRMTWFVAAAPVFLALPLLVFRLFSARPGMMESGAGRAFFSLEYLWGNLGHAVGFLFDPALNGRNSIVLTLIGIVVAVVLVGRMSGLLNLAGGRSGEVDSVLGMFGLIVCGNTLLALCNFWGQWDDPVVSRFSLPLHLIITLLFVQIVRPWMVSRVVIRLASGVLASRVAMLPLMLAIGGEPMIPFAQARGFDFLIGELRRHPSGRVLAITRGNIGAISYGYPSCPFELAGTWPWKLAWVIERGYYDEVLVLQTVELDPASGAEVVEARSQLPESFELETIGELPLAPHAVARVSRVKRIHGEAANPPAGFAERYNAARGTPEEWRLVVESLP